MLFGAPILDFEEREESQRGTYSSIRISKNANIIEIINNYVFENWFEGTHKREEREGQGQKRRVEFAEKYCGASATA